MIKRLASKIVYKNKWLSVREDQIQFQSGTKGIYGVVEKPDFALIIPFTGFGFYLVRQYRYPVEETFWEFPQGSHEDDPTIKPEQLAREELAEETGLSAGIMKYLGYLYAAYGFSNQGYHIFLAESLTKGEQNLEAVEEGMEVKHFSLAEFESMVREGEIKDASTLSAYGLLKVQGFNN